MGLFGIGWGLPSAERIAALLPAEKAADPAFHERMAAARRDLYSRMEREGRLPVDYITSAERIPPGSETPRLLDGWRSFFLRSANPDEQKNLTYLAHMRPRELFFEPYGAGYGGAFIYPLGAWYAALAAVRAVAVSSDLTVYFREPRLMAAVFVAGRLFNAACFAACAVLLLLLGRRLGCGGFAAGALFLVSPVAVMVSHTLNPYGWATAWFLAACLLLKGYEESGERRRLLVAAACVGMSVGSTPAYWTLGLLCAAPLLLRRESWREAVFRAVSAGAVCALVFVLTNPYLFLRWSRYAEELAYLMENAPFALGARGLGEFVWLFLRLNWGPLLTLGALGGMGFWTARPGLERLLALAFWAGALQLAGRLADPAHARHFLPFFALGCLAAEGLVRRLAGERRRAALAVLGLLLADAAAPGWAYLWNYRLESARGGTRLEAGRWIDANVPAGASIGLVAPPQPADTPTFRMDRYELVLFARPAQLAGKPLPEFLVISEVRESVFFEELLKGYEVAARFEAAQPVPWFEVRGLYTLSNIRVTVYRRA